MIDPAAPVFDTDAVLSRRLIAWLIDALLIAVLLAVLHFALALLGVLTLGVGWLLLGLLPLIPFCYSFGFLARNAATPGQRLLGLTVVEHVTGRAPTPFEALASTVLFWFSLTFVPILLIALFTTQHRTLHDLLSGLVVVRSRVALVQHGAWNMPSGSAA